MTPTQRAAFKKLLTANRGEIACRIIQTANRLGIRMSAIHSTVDANAHHVRMADEPYCVKGENERKSYLNAQAIIEIARDCRAAAIHPGYGFLSKNRPCR